MDKDDIVKLTEAAYLLASSLDVLDKSGLAAAQAHAVVEHAHNYFAGLWPVSPHKAAQVLAGEFILALEMAQANGVPVAGNLEDTAAAYRKLSRLENVSIN